MRANFTASFFNGNRKKLKALVGGEAPIVLTANGLLQRNNDSAFPFRQDSSFWYLTGIDEPDMILVIDGATEYLIVPDQSDYQHSFDGTIDYKSLSACSGIELVLGAKEGWKLISDMLKKGNTIATLTAPPIYIEPYGMYTNPARKGLESKIKAVNAKVKFQDLRPQLSSLRAIKQPKELNALQDAIDLTIGAIKNSVLKMPKVEYEYELEAETIHHFLQYGATAAWKPIVASGKNGTILHYIANRSRLNPQEVVYMDVGAEVSHYTSDITRTYSVGGHFSQRQQDVIDRVKEVQDYAIKLLKPGVVIKEYEKLIEHFMGEKLQELKLIKTINRESVRHYYPHATSHFLGLDAHDVGEYDKPLAPNMVLTVEPGIYIPEEGIGVRIEDDILITANGSKNLSASLDR